MVPASYRWATLLAVIISFQVALASLRELGDATHPETSSSIIAPFLNGMHLSGDAFMNWKMAASSGELSALTGLKPWRAVTLTFLAMVSGLIFFLSMRLRMGARHRERTALLLSRAAVAAAIIRVIDSAQFLVIVRSGLSQGLATFKDSTFVEGVSGDQLVQIWTDAISAALLGPSVLVLAIFVGLSSYFSSDRVIAGLRSLEKEEQA